MPRTKPDMIARVFFGGCVATCRDNDKYGSFEMDDNDI